MQILVTGGAGFLGSHLCRRLHEEGHTVLCLDNEFSGSKSNIYDLLSSPRFEFIRHDIVFPIFLEVERVYHLACPASPVHYQFNPIKTIKANVAGTMNMLGLAKRVKARFFQASTSEVYGDPSIHPQPESYWGHVNPYGSRACYDEGKRVAETLCWCYQQQHGMSIRIARIFNTYGPAMQFDDGRVVSNFIVQALSGHPLTIYGDGSQTRSFCYVDDLIDGFVRLMESDLRDPVNLGNPHEVTIGDLARQITELVEKITGRRSEIIFAPLPADDPTRRQPDISRARAELGWEPRFPLDDGLRRTIDDFRRRLDATNTR